MGIDYLTKLRNSIRRDFARCYWSEDSLTVDKRIPKEKTIEPEKFLERILKVLKKVAPKYLWMVTQDGSSEGYYENCACSTLFLTKAEAIKFVKDSIFECAINDHLVVNPEELSKWDIEKVIYLHAQWFEDGSAQYRNCEAVTDWKIERIALPYATQK